MQPLYQPIADLRRGTPAGYEVLLSIDGGEPAPPHEHSRTVHSNIAGRVEARLVAAALAALPEVPEGALLAVDVSAHAMLSDELPAALRASGRLERVVVVLTDDSHAVDGFALRRALEGIRELGGSVALDETGSGYASLRQLLAVRPDYVRIGAEFVVDIDRDQAKAAVVEGLLMLASRIDATAIACGIPHRAELAALRRMGVPLGQGPILGSVATEMGPLAESATETIRASAPPEDAGQSVAALVEARPPLPWGASLDEIADAFLDDPRNDSIVMVDERNRPLALADRASLLRGEPFERPIMRIVTSAPLKAVARRAAARPQLERFDPLVVCDRRGVYLGVVRVEALLEALSA